MCSVFGEIVEAHDYSEKKTIHPIVKVLTKSKAKNKTVQEILCNDLGAEFIPKYNFIFDGAGRMIKPGQLFEAYGINAVADLRCPICAVPYSYDTILTHLQTDFMKGHTLPTSKLIEFFKDDFINWRWFDGKFIK